MVGHYQYDSFALAIIFLAVIMNPQIIVCLRAMLLVGVTSVAMPSTLKQKYNMWMGYVPMVVTRMESCNRNNIERGWKKDDPTKLQWGVTMSFRG